jgi:sugar phosphate permease
LMARGAAFQVKTMSRRWLIFLITSSNFFLSQFYRASNAVIAPQLLHDLALDTEGLGLLSASFFYAFALTQIPIGVFLDRVGARRMMTGLSLLGVIGALIFSWADSLDMGLLGRALLGAGMACNLMGTFKLLTLWFEPRSFATLSGVVFAIGTVGNMAATTPLVLLVEKMGWRSTFQLIAGVNLFIIAALYVVVRDRPRHEPQLPSAPEAAPGILNAFRDLRLLFRNRDYWIISLGSFVSYGVFASFQTCWAGPFLMETMGFSAVATGNLIFLMNLGLIMGGPLWGGLSDTLFRTSKWTIFGGHALLGVVILVMATLPPGTGILWMAFLFFGFGLFRSTGFLMYPHIKELMPIAMAGAAMTGINFFTMMGPAVFLQGLGSLMQRLYPDVSRGPEAFQAALLLCMACLVGIGLLYPFTRNAKREPL